MPIDHRKYLTAETLISMLINIALSLVAAWLVFGRRDAVPMAGPGGFAFDFLPQTFMVSFMSTLVPTLLTRKRVASGQVAAWPGAPVKLPRNVLLRALLVAVLAAAVFGGIAMLIGLRSGAGHIPLNNVYVIKAFYGAVISIPVTWLALRVALAD